MRHANDLKLDLALVSRDWKKIKFQFLSFEQRTTSTSIFESWSAGDLLLPQRVAAGSREPAPASEGPGLLMGHFSGGAPPSLAF
jgi:hypothetical protein